MERDIRLFPRLRSSVLALERLHQGRISDLVRYANNLKISSAIVNIPFPYTEANAAMRLGEVSKSYLRARGYIFAIINLEEDKLIGEISLHILKPETMAAQLAYWVAEEYWGQGYASEATRLICNFGFEKLGFTHIYADCKLENVGSVKVLEKNGFRQQSLFGGIAHFVKSD